jgi:hypothetical protein
VVASAWDAMDPRCAARGARACTELSCALSPGARQVRRYKGARVARRRSRHTIGAMRFATGRFLAIVLCHVYVARRGRTPERRRTHSASRFGCPSLRQRLLIAGDSRTPYARECPCAPHLAARTRPCLACACTCPPGPADHACTPRTGCAGMCEARGGCPE